MVPSPRRALGLGLAISQSVSALDYTELYRPQCHFGPANDGINEMNGLPYQKEVYYYNSTSITRATHCGEIFHGVTQPVRI